MRDSDLLIQMLGEMAQDPSGRILVPWYAGEDGTNVHHAELLVDAGHADWTSEGVVRITNDGYDFLNAIQAQPKAKVEFKKYFDSGLPYADAAMKAIEFVKGLFGS